MQLIAYNLRLPSLGFSFALNFNPWSKSKKTNAHSSDQKTNAHSSDQKTNAHSSD
jgi:hypothetical protein